MADRAAALDALRRSLDLRLDAEGRWFQGTEPFTHPGIIALFDRGIGLDPATGECIVRIGDQFAYFKAEDTPFIVRRLRPVDGELEATLNNGERLTVPTDAFQSSADGILYVRLRPDRFARLSRGAQAALGADLVDDESGPVVDLAGRRWPIATSSRT